MLNGSSIIKQNQDKNETNEVSEEVSESNEILIENQCEETTFRDTKMKLNYLYYRAKQWFSHLEKTQKKGRKKHAKSHQIDPKNKHWALKVCIFSLWVVL